MDFTIGVTKVIISICQKGVLKIILVNYTFIKTKMSGFSLPQDSFKASETGFISPDFKPTSNGQPPSANPKQASSGIAYDAYNPNGSFIKNLTQSEQSNPFGQSTFSPPNSSGINSLQEQKQQNVNLFDPTANERTDPQQNPPKQQQVQSEPSVALQIPGRTVTSSQSNLQGNTQPYLQTSLNQLPKHTKNSSNRFLKFSITVFVLLIALIGGGAVFILTNPEHETSKQLTNNTFLKNYIHTPEPEEMENQLQTVAQTEPQTQEELKQLEFALAENQLTVTEAVEKVLPSVLSISVQDNQSGSDNLNQDLTSGSGFFLDSQGTLISNKHVVSKVCEKGQDNIKITGLSHDQVNYELELLSLDPIEDIAILRVKLDNDQQANFKPVELSDSNNLKLGQDVIAIGNVLGELQNTVTRGIVSGLNRSFQTTLVDECTGIEFNAEGLIQTDAAINRGNSGGPLFNSMGQLVGMNTLGTTDAENIGLSIASATIKRVYESFYEYNEIRRPKMQVETVGINPVLLAQNKWIPVSYGEIIYSEGGDSVHEDSVENQVGLQEGDIILEVDGVSLKSNNTNPRPLNREILTKKPGSQVKIKVLQAVASDEQSFQYAEEPVEIDLTIPSVAFEVDINEVKIR